jgi:general stress protein 26
MNSIDANQPEANHKDLSGTPAVAKMRELIDQATTCFFCTQIQTGRRVETRPMTIQEVDDSGRLWLLSASDSHQNAQIQTDGHVQLMFQGSSHSDFLTLYGTAKISRDRAKIDALWRPMFRTWFTGGKDDPRVTVIEVTPSEGYYWDTKHNRVIALAKIVAGALTGRTLDDSVQGTLRV